MAATAVIVGSVATSLVVGNQQKQKAKGDAARIQRDLESSIAKTPPPPSTAQANDQAGVAMAAAARRQRQIAGGAGGAASTILTSPQGAAPAPVQRKTLLGQ